MSIDNSAPLQGFGDEAFKVAVYLEKRPPMPAWQQLKHLHAIQPGQIN